MKAPRLSASRSASSTSPPSWRAAAACAGRGSRRSSTGGSCASPSRSYLPTGALSASARTSAGSSVAGVPDSVRIREVGPRDGFQNEPEVIATADKVRLIELLGATGLQRLEVTSFVRPDVIPQLADAEQVLSEVSLPDSVSVSVLIPNERGLERALVHRDRFDEINGFLSASETHNQKNVGRPIAESLAGLERTFARALADAGAEEVGFGDTTGMANPVQVREFFAAASGALPGVELTAHFHNTRGQGLANVLAALEAGVESFESSFGELGGCPVPAGATGNIATEDLVSMLHEMGIETGIDLPALIACARRAQEILGRPLGSHTLVAGPVDWR